MKGRLLPLTEFQCWTCHSSMICNSPIDTLPNRPARFQIALAALHSCWEFWAISSFTGSMSSIRRLHPKNIGHISIHDKVLGHPCSNPRSCSSLLRILLPQVVLPSTGRVAKVLGSPDLQKFLNNSDTPWHHGPHGPHGPHHWEPHHWQNKRMWGILDYHG